MANVKYMVTLTKREREELLSFVDKGSAPATQFKHASILLAVDRGHAGFRMTDAELRGKVLSGLAEVDSGTGVPLSEAVDMLSAVR